MVAATSSPTLLQLVLHIHDFSLKSLHLQADAEVVRGRRALASKRPADVLAISSCSCMAMYGTASATGLDIGSPMW